MMDCGRLFHVKQSTYGGRSDTGLRMVGAIKAIMAPDNIERPKGFT